MAGQQFNIDTISNNLANVNTTGYKKNRVDFEDLLYQTVRFAGTPVTAGAQIPVGLQVGHGVRPIATQKIFTPGSFKQTENPLDLAIEGDGFFQVLLPDGTIAYTRDGSFKRDGLGRIVTSDGTPVTAGAQIPVGLQVGHGVRPIATQKIFTPGSFKQTENPLDLAIEGDGFFQVLLPDGTIAYTRDGSFKRDGLGRIVTSDGFA